MITVQRLRRLELWSALQCAGGVRLRVFRQLFSCTAQAQLSGDTTLTAVVSLSDGAGITSAQVLRVDGGDGVFDEWLVRGVVEDSTANTATITADPVELALISPALIAQVDGLGVTRHDLTILGRTPEDILTEYVLPPLGYAWLSVGTVDKADPIDVTFQWVTPLAAVQQLLSVLGLEYQLRRNGTAGYFLDLVTAIGSTAPVADLRAKKNLPGLQFGTTTVGQANKIYPQGAASDGIHGTMGGADWLVTNVAGAVVTLTDPDGGAGPIAFDGQLTNKKLRRPDGSAAIVQGSSAAAQTVTLDTVSFPVIGDRIRFTEADGSELTNLISPADVTASGARTGTLERGDIPDVVNYARNADLRSWPAGNALPDHVALVNGAVPARETAQKVLGTQSLKVTCAADGDGVVTDLVTLPITADDPDASGHVKVFVESGQVRVELLTEDGTTYPAAPDVASNQNNNVWDDLGVGGIDLHAAGQTQARLRIVQNGDTPTVFYLNAVQITRSAGFQDFLAGSGPRQLWQAANAQLKSTAAPVVTLSATVVDLANLDPARWGGDCALVLGGTVRVTEPRLSVALTTRVLALTLDYLQRGKSALTLSNKPLDLTQLLTKTTPAGRVTAAPAPTGEAVLPTVTATVIPETATQGGVQLTISDPQSRVTRVEYRAQRGNATPSDWAALPSPYAAYVDLVDKQPSKIGWRVFGYNAYSVERELASGSETFAIGSRPLRPTVQVTIDVNGLTSLLFFGDSDTTGFRYLVTTDGSTPTDEQVRTQPLQAAFNRQLSVPNVADLDQLGQIYCIVAFAYNAAGAESDRAKIREPWVSTGNADVTVGAAVPTDHDITWPVTLSSKCAYCDVFYLEYPTDPSPAASVEYTGARPKHTPFVQGDGQTQLTIPVSAGSYYAVVTFVAYDGLGTKMPALTVMAQALAPAAPPPTTPPHAPTNAVKVTISNGSVTNRLTMPNDLTNFSKIRVYRDGVVYGADITRTAGANATQDVTHNQGLSTGVSYTWTYKAVAADGTLSTDTSPAVVTQMPAAQTKLPTPQSVVAGAYDTSLQGYVYTFTPGNSYPPGTVFQGAETTDGTDPGPWRGQVFAGDNTMNRPQPPGIDPITSSVSVWATCAGYTDSDSVASANVTVPGQDQV